MPYSSTTEDLINDIITGVIPPAQPYSSTTEDLIAAVAYVISMMLQKYQSNATAGQTNFYTTFPLYANLKVYVNGYLVNTGLYTFMPGSNTLVFYAAMTGGEEVTIANC